MESTTREVFLAIAQTLHMEQCIQALTDEEPWEPYHCPEWLADDLGRPQWHVDPSDLPVSEVPLSAFRAAKKFLDSFLRLNSMTDVEGIDRANNEPDMFGYKLAMQGMGHGVGLQDFYPDPENLSELRVPDVRYYGPNHEVDERFC
jgi:hypothetical protein